MKRNQACWTVRSRMECASWFSCAGRASALVQGLFPIVGMDPLKYRCVCLCIVSTCRHLMLQGLLEASVLRKPTLQAAGQNASERRSCEGLNPICFLHIPELRWTSELRQVGHFGQYSLKNNWVWFWLSMTNAFLWAFPITSFLKLLSHSWSHFVLTSVLSKPNGVYL